MDLNKPHYLFRPMQLIRRSRRDQDVLLPWGHRITVYDDDIGRSIMRKGVYELPTTEAIWRLLRPGECAIDAGANIGYMTSVMLARGANVVAVEPHPQLFATLERNVSRWGSAELVQAALSTDDLGADLSIGEDFADNRGTATLGTQDTTTNHMPVRTVTLDQLSDRPDLLKLDIEGHELAALENARALAHIRDILFEDNEGPTSALMGFLGRTFELRQVTQGLLGPQLQPVGSAPPRWEPQTFLATQAIDRATEAFRSRGWRSLRPRSAIPSS